MMQPPTLLRRSQTDRIIGGVAGGLGSYAGIAPSIIRLGWVAFTLLGGAGLLAYLAAWVIIPDQDGRRTMMPVLLLLLAMLLPVLFALAWLVPVSVTSTH